jgi:hypothetical protein
MSDYPPINASVALLVHNVYNWLEADQSLFNELDLSGLESCDSRWEQQIDVRGFVFVFEFKKPGASPLLVTFSFKNAHAARQWTADIVCGNYHAFTASFETLHNEFKKFFGSVSSVDTKAITKPKPTQAPRRRVEL